MGVALEKMTWGSWTPHKVKLAVSGCPRNCAEATIKDFGVIGVDSGWELHVGGNGGIKVRVTDLLCQGRRPRTRCWNIARAFMQLYREEARYLERTAPWIERVGLDYVQERARRRCRRPRALLHAPLPLFASSFAQADPWAERARGRATRTSSAPWPTVE